MELMAVSSSMLKRCHSLDITLTVDNYTRGGLSRGKGCCLSQDFILSCGPLQHLQNESPPTPSS